MHLRKCLTELTEQKKPVATLGLTNLSDLSQAEVTLFQETWEKTVLERRREVVDELIALAGDNAKLNFDSVFLSCLSDTDALVRAKAIEGLWECEDCTLISILVEKLVKDREDVVRIAAANAIGKFALLAELRKVNSRHITKIGDALFGIIDAEGENIELRCRAMEAIAPLALPRVKKVIYKAYRSGNRELRISAIHAMGLNCDPVWLSILLKEIDSSDPERCMEAIKACGELGGGEEEEEVVHHLLRLMRGDNVQIQLAVLATLKQIGGSEAKQALHQCLYHPNERVRQLAGES